MSERSLFTVRDECRLTLAEEAEVLGFSETDFLNETYSNDIYCGDEPDQVDSLVSKVVPCSNHVGAACKPGRLEFSEVDISDFLQQLLSFVEFPEQDFSIGASICDLETGVYFSNVTITNVAFTQAFILSKGLSDNITKASSIILDAMNLTPKVEINDTTITEFNTIQPFVALNQEQNRGVLIHCVNCGAIILNNLTLSNAHFDLTNLLPGEAVIFAYRSESLLIQDSTFENVFSTVSLVQPNDPTRSGIQSDLKEAKFFNYQ